MLSYLRKKWMRPLEASCFPILNFILLIFCLAYFFESFTTNSLNIPLVSFLITTATSNSIGNLISKPLVTPFCMLTQAECTKSSSSLLSAKPYPLLTISHHSLITFDNTLNLFESQEIKFFRKWKYFRYYCWKKDAATYLVSSEGFWIRKESYWQ